MPESYPELRSRAVEINHQYSHLNACVRGCGECCIASTPMTEGDVELLKQAIDAKRIPQPILDYARSRAQDPARDKCPFLGRKNNCLIYSLGIKPIVCEIFGFGGKHMNFNVGIGSDDQEFYLAKDLGLLACTSCGEAYDLNTIIPRAAADEAFKIRTYANEKRVTSTREFVLENL